MKLSAFFFTVLFSTLAFADEKSGNKLKVKINHVYKPDSSLNRTSTIQFKYDTKEWLQITNRPEGDSGIYLRRDEVGNFKAIMEKMLKFGDAVHKNQITGVKKTFEGENLPKQMDNDTYIDIDENVITPFSKTRVEVLWSGRVATHRSRGSNERWNLRELEELSKVFDERQKEVFKKYDLLKALND